MANFLEKNILFYAERPHIFPLSAKWGAKFVLNNNHDFALDLLKFASRFDVFSSKDFFFRRVAVHEAIMNALFYGGKSPILIGWGLQRFMQIGIMQENEIIWPCKPDKYRGTALIKKYSSNVLFSLDKKTLVLQFY